MNGDVDEGEAKGGSAARVRVTGDAGVSEGVTQGGDQEGIMARTKNHEGFSYLSYPFSIPYLGFSTN